MNQANLSNGYDYDTGGTQAKDSTRAMTSFLATCLYILYCFDFSVTGQGWSAFQLRLILRISSEYISHHQHFHRVKVARATGQKFVVPNSALQIRLIPLFNCIACKDGRDPGSSFSMRQRSLSSTKNGTTMARRLPIQRKVSYMYMGHNLPQTLLYTHSFACAVEYQFFY